MLPRADMTGTRPLATVEAPTPVRPGADPRQDVYNRLTQIAIGTRLQAEVLSRFDDGTFLVRVADTKARMNLPDGTRVGDSLSMTMLGFRPRPTFLLGSGSGSATTILSSAGRLIGGLLKNAQEQGASTALAGKAPLLASPALLSPAADVPQVATALHDTLSFSGLFYESHVHQWVNGGRSIEALMREPQAQAGKGLLPTLLSPSDTVQLESQTHVEQTLATDADTIVGTLKHDSISAESMQIIHLQLNTLEQQQVRWQGQLFPGQPMEWVVSEDTPSSENEQEATESSWQSAVRFELPALGAVSATIRLVGTHVYVQVNTATEETAASLRAHGDKLASALDAAGSPLDLLLIKQDERV